MEIKPRHGKYTPVSAETQYNKLINVPGLTKSVNAEALTVTTTWKDRGTTVCTHTAIYARRNSRQPSQHIYWANEAYMIGLMAQKEHRKMLQSA